MLKYLFFFLISFSLYSQGFDHIQKITNQYPQKTDIKQLASLIEKDFENKEDKVKAIYCWITKNIQYDLEDFMNPNRAKTYSFTYSTEEELALINKKRKDHSANKTLKYNKGICQGFTDVFANVCSLLNIENKRVTGNVRSFPKDIGNVPIGTNHVWNAVRIDDKWIFIDTTWGAGMTLNGKWKQKFNSYFYDIPASSFFKTHYPDFAEWRLLIGRIKKKKFYEQPIYGLNSLKSKTEIISKYSGSLLCDSEGYVKFQVKNLEPNQKIYIGFHGQSLVKTPQLKKKDKLTTISIKVPSNIQYLSLLLDMESYADFKIVR